MGRIISDAGGQVNPASEDPARRNVFPVSVRRLFSPFPFPLKSSTMLAVPKPLVEIEYCIQCRWLLRAAWFAQELLTTFEADLRGVTLVPSSGGAFRVTVDGKEIWSREKEHRFPEAKELKQAVRDIAAPGRDLGHSDK